MKDIYTKSWIIENAVTICDEYDKGILTLRALHYQLVGLGMTNDVQHYKRVVTAMISARWDNIISFDTFSDLDRQMVGSTDWEETDLYNEIDTGKRQIKAWMNNYSKNRWENQYYYPEVLIEKKALQGVFESTCKRWNVALGACKGYPSLTFLNDAYHRFRDAESNGKKPVIIYFGDYDPSGEDIPRSIKENLNKFGIDVHVERVALMEHQVISMKLPHAPTKDTDTRSNKWNGFGQVELDAVKPEKLMRMCSDAIDSFFDDSLYEDLKKIESEEKAKYRIELKQFVNEID